MISLADSARELGWTLTANQIEAFDLYYRELVDWNTRINLTTIVERDQVNVKHFLDSLSIAPILRSLPSTIRLIDIGTGAGFPGIPLKIALPDLRLTLVETTGKKVEFLKDVIAQLQLRDAMAIQARAEDLAHTLDHREQYDVAVARAVANLATLVEYALPFVRAGGLFIAQKGVDVTDEIKQASRALKELGGRVRKITPVQLPGLEQRHLVIIDKVGATPDKYPRRAGIPARKPLTN